MEMKAKLLIGTAIMMLAVWGSAAEAAQITFGPSNQSITFTGNGANSVTVSSPTLTGSAFDTTNGLVGSFTLSGLSFTAGPQVGGLFNAGANTETFTYTNPDGDTLTETWHITVIQEILWNRRNHGNIGGCGIPGRLRPGWEHRSDRLYHDAAGMHPSGQLHHLGSVGHHDRFGDRRHIQRRKAYDDSSLGADVSRSSEQRIVRAGLVCPARARDCVKPLTGVLQKVKSPCRSSNAVRF
jgi:hypothetical protein